ncbi:MULTISPECIES: hypothetical protein [Caulobacter]|nr:MULTISPECIES: hypothetical protein [Caulobacter]MBQ1560478.1 hypothetical protein [Caulobacter sp.]
MTVARDLLPLLLISPWAL